MTHSNRASIPVNDTRGTVPTLILLLWFGLGSWSAARADSIPLTSADVAVSEKGAPVLTTSIQQDRSPRPHRPKDRQPPSDDKEPIRKEPDKQPQPPVYDDGPHWHPVPAPAPPPIVTSEFIFTNMAAEVSVHDLAATASLALAATNGILLLGDGRSNAVSVAGIAVGAGTIALSLAGGQFYPGTLAAGVACFAIGWASMIFNDQKTITATVSF